MFEGSETGTHISARLLHAPRETNLQCRGQGKILFETIN